MLLKNNDLLGTLIHDVAYLLRRDIDSRLKPYNLTRVKWLALGVIERNGPMSQTELADALELGTASVGRLVDRLVEREFVIRQQDPNDRRSYMLETSPTAEALMRDVTSVTDDYKAEILTVLNDSEISALRSGLSKLKTALTTAASALVAMTWTAAHKAETAASLASDFAAII